jgi:group I intron endonuclease
MVGIYKIECKVDNKVYIGYSSNIMQRFSLHKYRLNENIHENSYLQNAWKKHGEDNFSFIVIEECSLEQCIEKEDYYVKEHKAYHRRFGYNLALTGVGNIGKMPKHIIEKAQKVKKENALKRGYWFKPETIKKQADGRRGFKHTEEAKEKIKIASTGRKKSKEVTQKTIDAISISVDQYSLNDEYIRTFKSITEALLFLNKGIKSGHISQCCKNKRKSAYGYKWKYNSQPCD